MQRGGHGLTWAASFLGAAPAGSFGHGEAGVPGHFSWEGESYKRVAVLLYSTKVSECQSRTCHGDFLAVINEVKNYICTLDTRLSSS